MAFRRKDIRKDKEKERDSTTGSCNLQSPQTQAVLPKHQRLDLKRTLPHECTPMISCSTEEPAQRFWQKKAYEGCRLSAQHLPKVLDRNESKLEKPTLAELAFALPAYSGRT